MNPKVKSEISASDTNCLKFTYTFDKIKFLDFTVAYILSIIQTNVRI